MELTKYAKMYLDRRLTVPFGKAPHLYEEFIKTFGTHFFQAGCNELCKSANLKHLHKEYCNAFDYKPMVG